MRATDNEFESKFTRFFLPGIGKQIVFLLPGSLQICEKCQLAVRYLQGGPKTRVPTLLSVTSPNANRFS